MANVSVTLHIIFNQNRPSKLIVEVMIKNVGVFLCLTKCILC